MFWLDHELMLDGNFYFSLTDVAATLLGWVTPITLPCEARPLSNKYCKIVEKHFDINDFLQTQCLRNLQIQTNSYNSKVHYWPFSLHLVKLE